MPENHLAGELSALLADLAGTAWQEAAARAAARLRQRAERAGLAELANVAASALELADRMCWDSLQEGRCDQFRRQAQAAGDIYEFATCAGLLRR